MKHPQPLFACEAALRAAVRRARRVALFTDFDGTLVRLRPRPEQAHLPAAARRRLAAIRRRAALVAIVSGRALADLSGRVGLHGVWYVGAHGFFLKTPSNRSLSLLNRKEKQRIARARRWLSRRLARVKGIRMEPKVATLAVHYRGAPRVSVTRARGLLAAWLEQEGGLRLLHGKKVWEILPRRPVSKWTAVRFILTHQNRERKKPRLLAFYLGDDVTDEDVFRRLLGVTIAVGKSRSTAARYYLRSPAEVQRFLEELNGWLA